MNTKGNGKEEAALELDEHILHDLNSMLLPILGYSSMIMDRTIPGEEIYNHARIIELAARRMRLINLSIIKAKRHDGLEYLKRAHFDLSEMLFEIEKFIFGLLPENITVEFDVQGKTYINGSRLQLERAFLNLAINACEAMPSGGRLTISAKKVSLEEVIKAFGGEISPGSYVLVSFKDCGVGIGKERIENLFDSSCSIKPHGCGIGLGSVFNIVRQDNAHITVESVEREGTCFKIYFAETFGNIDKKGASSR